MAIRLTLAVPTHNRAATLAETLASLAAQRLPADVDTECIVVDNNSSDRTPAVVDEAAARAPFAIRRVFETGPGSSFARNRAVDEAAGDFILFIDDDAVADSDWAALMLAAIRATRPGRGLRAGAAAMGGSAAAMARAIVIRPLRGPRRACSRGRAAQGY